MEAAAAGAEQRRLARAPRRVAAGVRAARPTKENSGLSYWVRREGRADQKGVDHTTKQNIFI